MSNTFYSMICADIEHFKLGVRSIVILKCKGVRMAHLWDNFLNNLHQSNHVEQFSMRCNFIGL